MWTGTVSFRELADKSRWVAEIFEDNGVPRTSSAFRVVPIGSFVVERREFLDPQASPDQQFRYLGLENVQSLTGDLVAFRPKRGEEIKSRSKVFRPGDILYGRLRPYLNKVYVADGELAEGICSGEFFVLNPDKKKVKSRFLRSLLASKYVQQAVSNRRTGSALPRLPIQDLLELEVPVPPLEIQSELEKFIVQEDERRRRLVAELSQLPERMIGAVTGVLESGDLSKLQELHKA